MILFPAIDLFEGKAVRLFKGDYSQMTNYGDPLAVSSSFIKAGAKAIHVVDLEGAKSGLTPNFEIVCRIKEQTGAFVEVGGGIRSIETVRKYLEAGLDRVILGTAAVKDEAFLKNAVSLYGERIAVGADVKDGAVAINGWTEKSEYTLASFFEKMTKIGVRTMICTDVSKDGAMKGTNLKLYAELSARYPIRLIASGGVSSLADVGSLAAMGLYGAIVGKAYYTGAIDLQKAIEVANDH